LSCAQRTDEAVRQAIIDVRHEFKHLGPRKLLVVLNRRQPDVRWPAPSTVGDILKRAGLTEAPRRRRRALGQGRPFEAVAAANDEWSVDFKGWFRTLDQCRIDPLTISDSHSRFLIDVRIVEPTIEGVVPAFEAAFARYGLPRAIRSDNGSPFGSSGAGGLTRLSAWWLKLGIGPRFTRPASPQDNARHERMHRTLKAQTSRPPAASAGEQQARFDAFRRHYNHERPHEALGQVPPAERFAPSPRRMPQRVVDPWYDAHHQVRRVRSSGEVMWRGNRVFISEALVGELVGIAELETGDLAVRFCDLDIGLIDRRGRFRRFAPPREGLRYAPEPPANVSTIIPV
jgi:transposase InsO family protein